MGRSVSLFSVMVLSAAVQFGGVVDAKATIIRLGANGTALSYASTADFVANTNFIILGTTPFASDLGYYVDPASGAIIRVAGSGIVLSYPSVSDFVANINHTALGTTPFGGDLGYYVDPASGDIIRVTGSALVHSYPSLADFVANSNVTTLGQTPFGGDPGFFAFASVPEPGMLLLLGSGLTGLAVFGRRRRS